MRNILAAAAVGLIVFGCGGPEDANSEEETSPRPAETEVASDAVEIPPDVSFSIMGSDIVPGTKRSIEVRLNRSVSEELLRAIALQLRSQDSREYEQTFITYYLPEMTVGAGAWATTYFDPSLEVRILGLTVEQEQVLVSQPATANRELIGSWIDEAPFVGSRIEIFHEDGGLYLEETFGNGSSRRKALLETGSQLGRRFDETERSSSGDHWIIDARGNLQLRDNDGLIRTATPIQ